MKKIIFNFYALLFALIINGCADLELQPLNAVTEQAFYVNSQNLEAGLYGIYDALQNTHMFGHQVLLDGLSDNCITTNNISLFAQGIDFDGLAGFYSNPYILIQRANLLLDNADNVSGIDSEDLKIIKAEARGLRALAYMRLVYLYGNIPLITNVLERNAYTKVNQAPREEVIDFILTEFQESAEILGNDPVENGRLTKQAILGFRAKVLLYEARLGNVPWSDALTAMNFAIAEASNHHGLLDTDNPTSDYRSLFTQDNENNSEFIFSVKNSETDAEQLFAEFFSWRAGILQMYPHQNLADEFDYADGSKYNPTDNTFENRDPRLSVNIMHPGLTFDGLTYGIDNGFVQGNASNGVTGLFLNKFSTTDFTSGLNEGALDVPVLRFADLLLMLAEVLNETNGDPYPALNAVRDRAGLPPVSGLSTEDMRAEIQHERRVEMAFEGQRWFDLITTGVADEKINGIVEEDPAVIRAFTPGRNELLPIPDSERALNQNLSQNPGY